MKNKTGCMQDKDTITNILQLSKNDEQPAKSNKVTYTWALCLYAWMCRQFRLTELKAWDSSK